MALLQSRLVVRPAPARRSVARVRCQAGKATVTFKIHQHVEYGQSLLVIGSAPELGSWDAKQAKELSWGEGDVWGCTVPLATGSKVEYKYIVKRKENLDWSPGQNKAVTVPAAAAVEVKDTWDHHTNTVSIVTPAAPAAVEAPDADEASTPVIAAAGAAAPKPSTVAVPPPAAVASTTLGVSAANALPHPHDSHKAIAVSTVENVLVEELEDLDAPHPPQPQLANNIVQAAPMGAVAVGPDPMTAYEEADRMQVLEVGSDSKATSTVAVESKPTLQSMTVSQIKTELKRRGLSTFGSRRELVTRLQNIGFI
ncbi:hypothetical protein HYH03_000593 [Edaphochlamys debaryana]|uniref:CBM20 domain-containing protein n=1 Tax=Edaphochlamys debaryana TaxID=47281 RepID=A0A835YJH8_9CHLO|nr:hypothetical protein HYH03_000593 [Edaphochlamys debaryana]|eukprot:KAG2502101.1 hypothetical protein HYH03_000593 [Edaphochlamys debaryana]